MVKIVANSLIGLILIFIWLKFVNITQIWSVISQVSLLSLLPVIICMFLSPAIRAVRLKFFLSEIKKVPLLSLIFLNGAAQMLNFFIPIRMGEIVKGVYLNTHFNLPLGKSVVWIFLDRFVDFLVVLAGAALLLLIIPTSINTNFVMIVSAVLLICLFVTYLTIFQQHLAQKLFNFLRALLIEKHIKRYFDSFSKFILESFVILKRHPKDLSILVATSILAYAADAGIWYFTFIALNAKQDFIKMYLGQLLSALTYLIPAAPGYIGSAEASGLLIFSGIFGINANLASAMIVLFHILSALFVLVFGLISVFSLKINLSIFLKKALNPKYLK